MRRRKLNTLISVLVILLFIAIFKVLYATNVPDNVIHTIKPGPSPESNIVSLYVETDKPSYSPGEVVQIYVSIKNIEGKNITLHSLDIGYIVYDSSKREVHSLGAFVTLVPTTILPQKEFGIRNILRWNTRNVAPGIYTIKVILFYPVEAVTEIEVEIKK